MAVVLFQLSDDREAVLSMQQIFDETPVLKEVLMSPVISEEKKETILSDIAKHVGLSEILRKYLIVMSRQDKIGDLSDALRAYLVLWDEAHQVVRAQVTFGAKPKDTERTKIRTMLEKKYPNRKIEWTESIDTGLMGGFKVLVGHNELDMSYEGCLLQLERKLTGR